MSKQGKNNMQAKLGKTPLEKGIVKWLVPVFINSHASENTTGYRTSTLKSLDLDLDLHFQLSSKFKRKKTESSLPVFLCVCRGNINAAKRRKQPSSMFLVPFHMIWQ